MDLGVDTMLCVIAMLDDSSSEKLGQLCKIVEEFGIPARYWYGHITMVSYLGEDEAGFIDKCREALAGCTEFLVHYDRLEQLAPTPSIVASPRMTPELMEVHRRLLSTVPDELDKWSAVEFWHPHTTLFYHTEADLLKIMERMEQSFEPITATISSIEFSKVTDKGYEIVDSIDLPTVG